MSVWDYYDNDSHQFAYFLFKCLQGIQWLTDKNLAFNYLAGKGLNKSISSIENKVVEDI